MLTESEFNKSLREFLELAEYHKTIEWWERLQSGKVQTVNMGWVQLCRKNTPDWIVAYYDREGCLAILFIEGKSDSGMKIIKEGQNEFMESFNKRGGFTVIKTNLVEEVKNFINENSFDRMKAWSEEVDKLNITGTRRIITEEELE